MNMTCTPILKFSLVGKFVNHHRVSSSHDNVVYECLYSMVEVACCKKDISSDALMQRFINVVLYVFFYGISLCYSIDHVFHINCRPWETVLVLFNFILDFASLSSQNCCKVLVPTQVSAAKGEKEVERSKVVEFGEHFVF